ncbi:MAG TPA: response regulator [Candidatus Limnocylindria bacterium]|nr:response regulator [Candidatus Limnocylindria bacterium]
MKKKVLLVDDEKSFSNLLKLNLEQTQRYEVCGVNCSEDAQAAAREFKPDIMLLDIIMPRMPGGNVVAQFEADPALKDVPIVFLTAAVQRSRVEDMDGIISGRPCLAKPASVEEIVAMIEKQTSGQAQNG